MTVLATALVTAVATAVTTLALTGEFDPTPMFDQDALEDGVRTVLVEAFVLTDAAQVTCPREVRVVEGTQFECAFTSGGQRLSVPVEVLNDRGQYRVGGPEREAADDAEA